MWQALCFPPTVWPRSELCFLLLFQSYYYNWEPRKHIVNLSRSWGFHSYYQEKKKEGNCEKCSLIKIAESCLVREKRNSVCIIYSSFVPLEKKEEKKNSNSIPIKLFSLVFGGPVIIWDRGGAGRPVLVWPTSTLRHGDPLLWSLWPLTSRVTLCRAATLPASLILRLSLPSVCLCFWVCVTFSLPVCLYMSVCKVLRLIFLFIFLDQTQLCNKCPSISARYSFACLLWDWQWLTPTDTGSDTSGLSRCGQNPNVVALTNQRLEGDLQKVLPRVLAGFSTIIIYISVISALLDTFLVHLK